MMGRQRLCREYVSELKRKRVDAIVSKAGRNIDRRG
jgi:hypothetical protein